MSKKEYDELLNYFLEKGFIIPKPLINISDEYRYLLSSSIQNWLREVYGISVEPTSFFWEKGKGEFEVNIYQEEDEAFGTLPIFKSYYEALEIGLQDAKKLIK